ncbi:transmembrane protein 17-like isoform X2 [Anopheles funestus]|uniref:transmembrane protein 17-like isoform X2 n=1 Tax=Anopheles funestus TaxID=62324 RepID=UPI0020C6A0A6|nr:transmembrane protein 17-like isoform X2 [Anopheles funestus]
MTKQKPTMKTNGQFTSKGTDYAEEEVISHLWVQLLIHINVYFYGIWLVVTIIFLNHEFATVSDIEKILSILSLVVAIPLEVIRLYLGHTGNLMSAIPSFAGFLILSLLIQLPLQIYLLLATHTINHTVATVVQSITILLLVLQIIVGIPAMRKLSAFRRKQFQIQRWQYMNRKTEAKEVR